MGTTLKSTLDHYIYIKGDLMIMCARYDLQWDKEARMSQIMHQRNCVGKTNYIHQNIYITIPWTRMHPQLPHFSAFIRIRGLWYVQVPFLQKNPVVRFALFACWSPWHRQVLVTSPIASLRALPQQFFGNVESQWTMRQSLHVVGDFRRFQSAWNNLESCGQLFYPLNPVWEFL